MNREEQFKERLRVAGERVTEPRVSVFRILLRRAPVPMAKLIERARAQGVDTVTVYRTVDLFRKLGVVQEVGLGRNRMLELGDDYGAHHHHVRCEVCERIIDFDSDVIEVDLARVGEQLGFEIRWHQLEATGVCAQCR